MGLFRAVARPMLSAMFVSGGVQQLSDPESHIPIAKDVTEPLQEAAEGTVPQVADADATQLVQLNGLVQVLGGLLLAAGKLPRVSALLLAGSLVPTTLAGHRFWEEDDPEARQQQQVHFFKNVSLLGGLLIATMDREGKPSVAWRGGHAVDHAKIAADHAKEVTQLKGELAKEKAKHAGDVAKEKAKHAGDVAKERTKRKGAVAKEKARRRAATAVTADPTENVRLRSKLAGQKAKQATKVDATEHARVRKELAKKRLTPDVADAKRLVGAIRSNDDD